MRSPSFKKDLEAYPRTTRLYRDQYGTCCAAVICCLYTDEINDDCYMPFLSFNLELWRDGHSHELPALYLLAEKTLLQRDFDLNSDSIDHSMMAIHGALPNDRDAPEKRQFREAITQRHAVTIVSICAEQDQKYSHIYEDSLEELCEWYLDVAPDLLKVLMAELGRPASKLVAKIIEELVFGRQRQAVAIISDCMENDVETQAYRTDSLATVCQQWPRLGTNVLIGLVNELGRPALKAVSEVIEELVLGKQRQSVAVVSESAKADGQSPGHGTDSLATLCEQWPDLGTELLKGLLEELGRPASKVVVNVIEELVFGQCYQIKATKSRDFD